MATGVQSGVPANMGSREDLSESVTAVYANHCRVGQNASEFVIDFGQHYEEEPPVYHTRIITTPVSMEEFVATMQEALGAHRKLLESSGEKTGE